MTNEVSVPIPLDPIKEDAEDKRLWIGNLDPRVTEFALLKLLQQYGSIEKFDLLFHRSGPLEGQPRGYAFVTYSTSEGAKKAQEKLNGRQVGEKILSVKCAHSMTKDSFVGKQKFVPNIPALAGAKTEKKTSKMTTIQAIEAKLKTMEATSSSLEFEVNKRPNIYINNSANFHSIASNKTDRYKQKPYCKTKHK